MPRFCPSCGAAQPDENAASCVNCSFLFDSSDPMIGKILGGKWKIVAPIGEGGMGLIFKAEHLQNGEIAALKLLQTQYNVDENAIKRFYYESQILHRMTHPNIVKIYEFGFEEQLGFYIAMEFLQGCTLEENLELTDYKLPFDTICVLFDQICDAMEHAHQQEIIHRDLKPDNIFLIDGPNHFDNIRLLDFGIAKLQKGNISKLTQTGMLLGTPRYVAPEQIRGKKTSPMTDIYALSIILFELLTGKDLFTAETPYEYLMRHVQASPSTLSEVCPEQNFPDGLEELILQGLSKEPKKRPSSMKEFRRRLLDIMRPLYPDLIEELEERSRQRNQLGSYSLHQGNNIENSSPPSSKEIIIPTREQLKHSQTILAKNIQRRAVSSPLAKKRKRRSFQLAPPSFWDDDDDEQKIPRRPPSSLDDEILPYDIDGRYQTKRKVTPEKTKKIHRFKLGRHPSSEHSRQHSRKKIVGALHSSVLKRQKFFDYLRLSLLFLSLFIALFALFLAYRHGSLQRWFSLWEQRYLAMRDKEPPSLEEIQLSRNVWKKLSKIKFPHRLLPKKERGILWQPKKIEEDLSLPVAPDEKKRAQKAWLALAHSSFSLSSHKKKRRKRWKRKKRRKKRKKRRKYRRTRKKYRSKYTRKRKRYKKKRRKEKIR